MRGQIKINVELFVVSLTHLLIGTNWFPDLELSHPAGGCGRKVYIDHTSVDHTSVDHTSVDHTSVDHRSVDHILTLHMHRSKEQMREDTSKPLKIELLYLFCLLFICQLTGHDPIHRGHPAEM